MLMLTGFALMKGLFHSSSLLVVQALPSVLRHCSLSDRKDIQYVEKLSIGMSVLTI